MNNSFRQFLVGCVLNNSAVGLWYARRLCVMFLRNQQWILVFLTNIRVLSNFGFNFQFYYFASIGRVVR